MCDILAKRESEKGEKIHFNEELFRFLFFTSSFIFKGKKILIFAENFLFSVVRKFYNSLKPYKFSNS